MKQYILQLEKLGACQTALDWCERYPTLEEAWQASQRGDWMLWLAGRLAGPPGDDSRRPLTLAACECARLGLPYMPTGEERPRRVIEAAEDWARGGPTTLAEVKAAAASAAHAADAAFAAADAADAAYFAAFAAATAAYAADAAARAGTLATCADIVRKYYPHAPELEAQKNKKRSRLLGQMGEKPTSTDKEVV